MKKLIALLILTTVWLAVSSCENSGKQVQLRFKYQHGMKLSYNQISKGTVLIYAGDSTIRNRANEIQITHLLEVTKILNDSLVEISENKEYQFHSIDLLDSTRVDTTETGPEIILQVSPDGRIHNFQYSDEKKESDKSYLKNFYDQGMPVFPNHSISQGYNWTQNYKVILDQEEMDASTTYTVKSFARERGFDCILISYEGKLILPIESNPSDSTERQGVDRVTTSGILYFAYKEGFVVLQKERWLLDGDRRKKLKSDAEFVSYNVAIEYDVEYSLSNRSY